MGQKIFNTAVYANKATLVAADLLPIGDSAAQTGGVNDNKTATLTNLAAFVAANATSLAGVNVALTATAPPSGNVSGTDVVLTPSLKAGSGTRDGAVIIRQPGGVVGTDELQMWHDGTNSHIAPLGELIVGTGSADTSLLRLMVPNQPTRSFYWSMDSSSQVEFAWGGSSNTRNVVFSRCESFSIADITDGQQAWRIFTTDSPSRIDRMLLHNVMDIAWCDGASNGTPVLGIKKAATGTMPVAVMTDGSTGLGWLQNSAGRSRVTTSDVTNITITPANITGLSATLIAGRKYAGEMVLFCSEATAADGLRLDYDGGTATMTSFLAQGYLSDDGGFQAIARTTALATDTTNTTITGSTVVVVRFAFVCANAGTFIPRFAKEADAAGAALTVTVGSYMMIEDMP